MKWETVLKTDAAVGPLPSENCVGVDPQDSISLGSCSELEWIVMKTRGSVYDLVVLSGAAGDVLIRGGRFFPEFRRVTVVGSIFGPAVLKLRSICVGMQLAVDDGEKPIITSRIEAVSRRPFPTEPEP
jgi:hypothetical protein